MVLALVLMGTSIILGLAGLFVVVRGLYDDRRVQREYERMRAEREGQR